MTSRNLTEVFSIMRHNASKNRTLYTDDRIGSDDEGLLTHSMRDAEEGLELRDDYGNPPVWLEKLEEAQYSISKIKPKLDELSSLHARHLLRPAFDERCEEEIEIEKLSQEISKLITSTHRHIQCIRSSLGIGSKLEQRLTSNVLTCLMLQLQDLTNKFRNNQNNYLKQLNSREERSQKYFETGELTNIDLNVERDNFVDTFDNFLQPNSSNNSNMEIEKLTTKSLTTNNAFLYEQNYENDHDIDVHFQRPVTNRMTQQQLLLFEEDNTRLAQHREEEVTKIVKSIYDLNDIFKDLGQMVQEQGTVLDRIDYNVEHTHTRVSEGLRQLQRAEAYQRKNRKMYVILILAATTLILLLLLIATKL